MSLIMLMDGSLRTLRNVQRSDKDTIGDDTSTVSSRFDWPGTAFRLLENVGILAYLQCPHIFFFDDHRSYHCLRPGRLSVVAPDIKYGYYCEADRIDLQDAVYEC
jgi:hypothetical protein